MLVSDIDGHKDRSSPSAAKQSSSSLFRSTLSRLGLIGVGESSEREYCSGDFMGRELDGLLVRSVTRTGKLWC